MLEKVLSIFKSHSLHRLALVSSIASNIIKTFEQEFQADGDAKKAAVDTLISLLQTYKSSEPVAVAPLVPPIPAPQKSA